MADAVRHTPAGSPVRIHSQPDRRGVVLIVEDEGPGIPPVLRDRIFEPFQHGADVQTHAPGTGIGQTLVGRFADLHGGRAWVEAGPDGGPSLRLLLAGGPA